MLIFRRNTSNTFVYVPPDDLLENLAVLLGYLQKKKFSFCRLSLKEFRFFLLDIYLLRIFLWLLMLTSTTS
jgi:hypothetical protein